MYSIHIHTFCSFVFFLRHRHTYSICIYAIPSPKYYKPIIPKIPFSRWSFNHPTHGRMAKAYGNPVFQPLSLPGGWRARLLRIGRGWSLGRNFRWKLSTNQVPPHPGVLSCFWLIGKVKYSNNLWFVLKVSCCILENICTKKVSEGLGRQIKLIFHVPLAFAGSEFYPPWN